MVLLWGCEARTAPGVSVDARVDAGALDRAMLEVSAGDATAGDAGGLDAGPSARDGGVGDAGSDLDARATGDSGDGRDGGDGAAADVGSNLRDAAGDVTPDAGPVTVLRVHHPSVAGRSFSLRGDLSGRLSWERGVSFQRLDTSTAEWRATGVSQTFEWKPLVDDQQWSRGQNYRAEPGQTVDVWPYFGESIGRWSRRFTLTSAELGNTRGVWVYLPPSYDEQPTRRYPVIYLHDGQNLFDPAAAFGGQTWQAHDAMNAGIEAATLCEAIVVGVENTSARIDEYTPTRDAQYGGGRGEAYLRFLRETVVPRVDAEFRTRADRANRALMGSSLGGLISAYAGVRAADVFGLIGILSPSSWWDGGVIVSEVASLATRPVRPLRVYIDSGDSGPSQDDVVNTRAHADAWRRLGYREGVDFRYLVAQGATHTEAAWAARLRPALEFLVGPRRND